MNVIATRVPVIARVSMVFNHLLPPNDPKQSAATKHGVCRLRRFGNFIFSRGGLLRAIETGWKYQDYASTRNDGLSWQFFLVCFFFFQISYLASAQTPYTGGSGDGHAMGELVLRPVSVAELSSENGYAIYPSLAKPNEAIYITSPKAGEFMLVDLTGRTVIHQTLAQPVSQLPIVVTGAGSYIAIIRTAEGAFTQKIMVIE